MRDQPTRGDQQASTSAEEEASSADLLPLHEGEELEDADDGLEIDEQQSEEIRRIFATTLPQYLIPVEEMIEQCLSGSGGAEGMQALQSTVASLGAAAARMGFAEVEQQLERLAAALRDFEAGGGEALERTARETVLGELLDLKDLAALLGDQSGEPAWSDHSESLVRALSRPGPSGATILQQLGAEGLEGGVLPRLSAAGLVSVEQLCSAPPAEVAAVSGLSLPLLQRLIGLLSARPGSGPGPAAADEVQLPWLEAEEPEPATPPAPPAAPAGSSEGAEASIIELPGDPARRELVRRLRDQVEAEAGLDELRVEVHRLRARISQERHQLCTVEESCRALELATRHTDEQLREGRELLLRLRAERSGLCEAADRSTALLRQQESRALALREERQSISEEDSSMGQEVQLLVDRVGGLLRQVAQGVVTERAGRALRRSE